jgi:transposase-like protein
VPEAVKNIGAAHGARFHEGEAGDRLFEGPQLIKVKIATDGADQALKSFPVLNIGINTDGYRQILGVELSGRESQTSWREFLVGLNERGLYGVEFVVSDDHQGLRKSLMEILPEAAAALP